MATKAQSSFRVVATMDGSTVNAWLRVSGLPLIQSYNEAGDANPDFSTTATPPTIELMVLNVSTGSLLYPTEVAWKYNGVTLTFDDSGMSTNSTVKGVFKRITSHSTTYNGKSVTVQALQVVKNLVSVTNYDNDKISCSGTVEISGNGLPFDDVNIDVIIREASAQLYDVIVDSAGIDDGTTSVDLKARIYQGGEITDYSGFSFEWAIIDYDGDTVIRTAAGEAGRTVTVQADQIDWQARIRCTAAKDGNKYTGFATVWDNSDPIYVEMQESGNEAKGYLRPGENVTFKPVARKTKSGSVVSVSTWDWRITDNAGNDKTLSGYTSHSFSSATCKVTYDDAVGAQGAVNGYVSAEIEL